MYYKFEILVDPEFVKFKNLRYNFKTEKLDCYSTVAQHTVHTS